MGGRTGRRVRVVAGKRHGRFEVATVVEGVRVEDDQPDIPGEDVIVFELDDVNESLG